MATENPMRVMAANGIRGGLVMGDNAKSSGGLGSSAGQDSVAQELGMLLRSHSRLDSIINKIDAASYRSGSAPPSVGGSLASIGGLFASAGQSSNGIGAAKDSNIIDSEHEVRSDPAYLAYYYSRVNHNPRLPPPLVTRENYYLAQRLAAGGYGDARKLRSYDDRSLFSSQSALPTHNEEPEFSDDEKSPMGSLLRQVTEDKRREMNADGLSGFSSIGLRNRPKSLVDLIQEDFPRTPSPVYSLSRPSSRVANEDAIDGLPRQDIPLTHHFRDSSLVATGTAGPTTPGLVLSNSRSSTPNPGLNSRSATPSDGLARMVGTNSNVVSSVIQAPTLGTLSGDIAGSKDKGGTQAKDVVAESMAALQNLRLSGTQGVGSVIQQTAGESQVHDYHKQHSHHHRSSGNHSNGAANNVYAAAAAAAAMSHMTGNPYPQNLQAYAPHYGLGGYGGVHPALLPAMIGNYSSPVSYDSAVAAAAAAAAATLAAGVGVQSPLSGLSSGLDIQQLYRYASQGGAPQSPLQDQLYHHFLQQYNTENARMAATFSETSLPRGYAGGAEVTSFESQRPYLNSTHAYPVERRVQSSRSFPVGVPLGSNNGSLSPAYYGSPPGIGFGMPYASSPISSPVLPGSPVIPGAFSFRQADPNYVFPPSSGRNTTGGTYAGWQGHKVGEVSEGNALLEELKSNKMRRFELADIAGHVVEFSADQHGSRFIQQKLETVSLEDKASVFKEVLPHALTLMTDVFGNYVIQKFFEHGSPQQRSELADCLVGHVLTLSLQMYGCRVIQKALEVIEVEKQVQLVAELDGQVMRCVRDQNGNHVIQKCIECVPSDHIQFIISAFHGQVIMLSTHPYGCRVIQRILEHCTDEQKLNGMMDEILRAVCTLAQDQYGNYVVQHILEHGKPHEKHEIIRKLAGQIVPMSQHKFASNVVEKCLEFGGRVEREILIKEMLGNTDENEPLQAMMKDQYANYVVQKVLETCDDHHRELLLSRIRVHLHALKKYTYGKHIVARVEKLLAAGERRGARMS